LGSLSTPAFLNQTTRNQSREAGGRHLLHLRVQNHALVDDGSWLTATMFGSLFVGLLAVGAGIVVAKTWLT